MTARRLALPPLMAVPRKHRGAVSARYLMLDHWRITFAKSETVRVFVHACCARRAA